MELSIKDAIFIGTIIGTVGLGVIVIVNNVRSVLNWSFFAMSLMVAFWILANLLTDGAQTIDRALFWSRMTLVGPTISIALALYFCLNFPSHSNKVDLKKLILLALPPVIILFFVNSDYNIVYAELVEGRVPIVKAGPLYIPFFIYGIAYLISFFVSIGRKFYSVNPIERKQISYILLGISLSVTTGLLMNAGLVLASIWGVASDVRYESLIGELSSYAPLTSLFFLSSIGLAILRHGLLNVKVIGTEIFAGVIVVISLVEVLMSSSKRLPFRVAIFFLTLMFAVLLIQSMLKEVARRRELERLSRSLKKLNQKLIQIDKTKSEFISIASHQLRTPLTSIKGYASLMIEGSYGKLSKEQKETVEKIYVLNERLIMLVEDLLNVSRIERGKIQYECEDVKLDTLIRNVLSIMKIQAKNKNLYIKFKNEAKDLPKVRIDFKKTAEAIGNLIDNAIKYTEKGGITVTLLQHGNAARVAVADTGIGIDQKEIGTLFEKFIRGEGINRLHTGGTGLGLYIARKLVEAHGGKVWVESPGLGKGSTFYVELPLVSST